MLPPRKSNFRSFRHARAPSVTGSEVMEGDSFRRTSELRQQPTGSNDQVGLSVRDDMHELGNHICALQFCLRQLGGNQRSDELEGLVRKGLDVCAQGIAAFRRVDDAVSVRNRRQSDRNLSQARRFDMLAAEYRAIEPRR